jgi:hypothetical protein
MVKNGNKVFVSITNKQIYEELCQFKEENAKQHQEILSEIASYKSQLSNLKYALGGIGVLVMTMLGFLVNHLGRI